MSSATGVPRHLVQRLKVLSKGLHKTVSSARRRCATNDTKQELRSQSMIKNAAALAMTTFAMVAFCPLGRAQNQAPAIPIQEPTIDSTIAVVRANMQADRTTLITTGMNFNDKDGAAFWPIYKEYEYERSKLDDRRVAVIKEYAHKYPNITDSEAKAMAEKMLQFDADLAALKKKYYKKFN